MHSLPANLEAKIERIPFAGCWLWTGTMYRNGYGNIHVRPRNVMAHRHIYTLLRGAIPEGRDLDHLCRVRCCVNPDHLEPVTRHENLRRGGVIDRLKAAAAARHAQSHCKRGHEMTLANSYTYPDGRHRQCRECMRAYQRNWRKK